jgi:hypothetical protein
VRFIHFGRKIGIAELTIIRRRAFLNETKLTY